MDFYNEPGFWGAVGAAFGFLTALITGLRWLARVVYLYNQKNIMIKAKFDSTIEKQKSDNIARLEATIARIEPVVNTHEVKMATLEVSLKNIQSLERHLTMTTDDLKISYENFNRIIPKVTASGQLLLDRMVKIETEIKVLKEGSQNIFVGTKK